MSDRPPIVASDFAVMTYTKREFVFVPVEQNELNTLCTGYNSVHFGLFGLCFGCALTAAVTLLTGTLPQNMKIGFLASSLVFLVASIYFGLMARKDYSCAQNLVKRIEQSKATTGVAARPSDDL